MTEKNADKSTQNAQKPSSDVPAEPILDIDSLLDSTPAQEPAAPTVEPTPPVEPAAPALTPEQQRIAELEAELAKPAPAPAPEPFVPTERLTPDQQRIRDLEDRVAKKRDAEAEAAGVRYDTTEGAETILIHFLVDGFTAGGQVWYRGQEVEYVVGSPAHTQQIDRNGNSWLDLAGNVAAQYQRFGRQVMASGPWPGKPWGDTSGLTDPEEIKAAQAAADAERRRGRRAPMLG